MATNKRAAAREWKRKRKQQQTVFKMSIAAVCALVILGIGYFGWDMWSRTYVMTFEGERISRTDMEFFSLFADGTMDTRVQALEHLTQYLLMDQAARSHGIQPTASEWDDIRNSALELLSFFEMVGMPVPNISEDRMTELMSSEFLSERLMDIYTADLVIDETEFQHNFIEFLAFNRTNFIEMDFRYHITDNMPDAIAVWDLFMTIDPEGFDEIILREMNHNAGDDTEITEVPTISLAELRQEPDIHMGIVEVITNLEIGEFTEPIQIAPETFIILIADTKHVPADEEIEAIFREQFTANQRFQAFSDVLDGWRDAADIRINQRGVNAA